MTGELLVGGRIYTPTSTTATALAVEDGVITWVGEDHAARTLHPHLPVTDLDGAFVAPAFVDTHVHLSATGIGLRGPDLTGSREQVIAALAASEDDVVIARGWDDADWEQTLARTDLDERRVVYCARIDEHSAQASTALRDRVPGLAALEGYSPDGPLTADAHHAVRAAAHASLADAQLISAQVATLDAAAAAGIAAVHECGGPDIAGERDFALLSTITHGVGVLRYWGEAASSVDHARDLMARTGAHGLAGDLFVDGSLGSHTALLHDQYCDAPTHGVSYLDQDTVTRHVLACTEARIQAGFHAIGDAAVHRVVTAFDAAAAQFGGPRVASCAHRIEHAEMVTAEQAVKLGSWGVIASMQPLFDELWGGPEGMYADRLGAERAATLNDFATLARHAVPLAFSSDSPVTPLDPWATVRAATRHHTEGSAISPRAAFAASTRGAWRAGGARDGLSGTLVPGAPATFALWDADELVVRAPSDAVQRWSTDPRAGVAPLPDLAPGARLPRCLRTVVAGRTVFAA